MMRTTLGMALAFGLVATGFPAVAGSEPSPDSAATARTALRGALMLRDLPLRSHATCRDVGPHPDDKTVGDYLAGFLAALTDGTNQIKADCQPAKGKAGRQRCEVWLKHTDKEDQWAWGLQFDMTNGARKVDPASVRCLGAG